MHIGLIPDGNRRYMVKQHIKNLLSSYDMGIKKFYDFLDWCAELGVDEVTIYALSLENITNRGKKEIETLFKAFNKHALDGLSDKTLKEKKIKVRICGDMDFLLSHGPDKKLSKKMVENLTKLQDSTKDNKNFTVNLAIAYGGRQEIIQAAKKLVKEKKEITEENIRKNLWVKSDPDLIIRTSEERISNFLMWQSAYSEIYFIPKLWQEFTKDDLQQVLSDYGGRERRYGR